MQRANPNIPDHENQLLDDPPRGYEADHLRLGLAHLDLEGLDNYVRQPAAPLYPTLQPPDFRIPEVQPAPRQYTPSAPLAPGQCPPFRPPAPNSAGMGYQATIHPSRPVSTSGADSQTNLAFYALSDTLKQFTEQMQIQALSSSLKDMPQFYGKPEEDFEEHLQEYSKYCQRLRLTDKQVCSNFSSSLNGRAAEQYKMVTQDERKAGWKVLMAAARKHLVPPLTEMHATAKMLQIRQGRTECVTDYVLRLNRYARIAWNGVDMAEPAMDKLKLTAFLVGLRTELKQRVPAGQNTYQRAVEKARAAEGEYPGEATPAFLEPGAAEDIQTNTVTQTFHAITDMTSAIAEQIRLMNARASQQNQPPRPRVNGNNNGNGQPRPPPGSQAGNGYSNRPPAIGPRNEPHPSSRTPPPPYSPPEGNYGQGYAPQSKAYAPPPGYAPQNNAYAPAPGFKRQPGPGYTCFNCGEPGHMRSECPAIGGGAYALTSHQPTYQPSARPQGYPPRPTGPPRPANQEPLGPRRPYSGPPPPQYRPNGNRGPPPRPQEANGDNRGPPAPYVPPFMRGPNGARFAKANALVAQVTEQAQAQEDNEPNLNLPSAEFDPEVGHYEDEFESAPPPEPEYIPEYRYEEPFEEAYQDHYQDVGQYAYGARKKKATPQGQRKSAKKRAKDNRRLLRTEAWGYDPFTYSRQSRQDPLVPSFVGLACDHPLNFADQPENHPTVFTPSVLRDEETAPPDIPPSSPFPHYEAAPEPDCLGWALTGQRSYTADRSHPEPIDVYYTPWGVCTRPANLRVIGFYIVNLRMTTGGTSMGTAAFRTNMNFLLNSSKNVVLRRMKGTGLLQM